MRSHWEQIKLADLFELQMGKTPAREKEQYWKNGTRKWVSIADISKFSRYTENTKESITDQAVSETGIRQVPANTIIMSFKLSLGKVAITSEPLYTNEAIMAFVDRKERPLSLSFLFHLFKNKDWSAGTNKAVLGMTLNKATLKEISIPVPPLSEQEDIAEKLDAVSRLITLREQQLQKLDQLASSRFSEMFGDPVTNPRKWNIKKISDFATVKIGPFGSALHADDYITQGHPVINPSHIVDGTVVPDNLLTISESKYCELSAYHLRQGDVVIGRRGEIGRAAVITDSGLLCGTGSMFVRISDSCRPDFLQKIISYPTFKAVLEDKAVGVTMKNLNAGMLETSCIPLPPLELQNEFAAFVEQLDKSKVICNKMHKMVEFSLFRV